MILQALVKYYEMMAAEDKLSKQGYCTGKVSYALELSGEGELCGITTLRLPVEHGKKKGDAAQLLEVPEQESRSVNILPFFLCDNAIYLLGLDTKGNPKRALQCFEASKKLHREILSGVDHPAARAILAFFDRWDPAAAAENRYVKDHLAGLTAGGNLIFQADDQYAQGIPALREAWEAYCAAQEQGVELPCLVTGARQPIAILHGKIRGVKDAQSVGANLVSFNSSAYESYGRDKAQGLNAPVGKYAAFAYVTALNALLANSEHRLIISDTTVVFWAESANPDFQILFNAAMNPKEDNQKMLCAILEKISRGLPPKEGVNPETPFYILGLAPNAARLSVRFFLQDSFGNFLKHIQQHYSDMEIEKAPYEFPYLSPYWLLRETVNPNAKDKSGSHLLSGAVMRSILTGAPYPQALMNAVMLRIHAEQDDSERHIKKITRGRAAIIKGYLIRRHRGEEEYKEVLQVSINEESKNKAYVLGRLFAILEKAQLEAYPNINTTIKDRYFTSACATPGSVFPTLIKLSRHHIRVIKDIKLKCYLDNQIKDLIDKLDVADTPFPAHFSLEDQGSFVLGYYQQTQKRYMKKSDSDVKEEA